MSYCKRCPAGRYSIHPIVNGKVNIQRGTSGEAACTACDEGYFGDENTYPDRDTTSYCQKCPAGHYGDKIAETEPACAGKCAKGFYCPPDIVNTHAYGATPTSNPPWKQIAAGYYGSEGSSTSNPHVCPAGYFCPTGSGNTDCTSDTTSPK